jgi:hypothetical protein
MIGFAGPFLHGDGDVDVFRIAKELGLEFPASLDGAESREDIGYRGDRPCFEFLDEVTGLESGGLGGGLREHFTDAYASLGAFEGSPQPCASREVVRQAGERESDQTEDE